MEFICIAVAHFLALLSPGPDFFLIMQASLRLPFRYSVAICAGIASANGIYLLCAVVGLQVLKNIEWLMTGLTYLGAGYLILLGIMLLRTSKQSLNHKNDANLLQKKHLGYQFIVGFMSGILNPKNMVFYLSLFTVMVSAQTPLFIRFLYAVWMISIVFVWDCAVVMILGKKRVKKWLGSTVFYIEKLTGIMLTFFGVTILFA